MKGDEGGNFSKNPDRKPLFLLKVKIKQEPACRNKEYNVACKHFHQNIRAYPRSWKNLHWPMIGEMLHIRKNGENAAYLGGPAKPGNFCNFSPLLNLEIVFPALKLTRHFYLNNIFFFHENCQFDQKILCSTNILCLLIKYEINETSKIPISILFSDLGKICKCNRGYIQSVTYIQNT